MTARIWIMAARPRTLPATVAPVLVGTSLALGAGSFDPFAFLAAFGRAIAEVGAIIIVGGNIRGYTRSMTTTIALETSRGDLSLALALGIILLALSMAVSATSLYFGRGLTER